MRVYLDHNATTPVRDEVVEAMARVLRERFGNPSSVHAEGSEARAELDTARERVAATLGARPAEIVFTAGATEANNTALLGAIRARGRGGLVSTTVEHPSVEAALERLESDGVGVTRVRVDADGRLDADALAGALTDEVALVSILWANNETGVVQDMDRIAAVAKERGILLHVDATQAVGKIPVDVSRVPVDLLSLSAHKFNGPKGVGCLFAREGVPWEPHLLGGPQESRRRGGTENLAGIVGLGVACELARNELSERGARYAGLRDRLWDGIRERVPRVRRNGSGEHVLPNTLNVGFQETAGEVVLQALDLEGVAASSGAACHSGSIDPSHVLTAMGLAPEEARGSLRFSVGHGIDEAAIDRVLDLLPGIVERARKAEAA